MQISPADARHAAECAANIAIQNNSASAAELALRLIADLEAAGERPGVAKLLEVELDDIMITGS